MKAKSISKKNGFKLPKFEIRNCRDMIRLTIEEFEKIVEKVRPKWAKEESTICRYWKTKYFAVLS